MKKFLVEFSIKVNKVKASGTVVSDGVLGYALLNAANLPDNLHSMIKATCDELTFNNVKCQLEKIGFSKSKKSDAKFSTSSEAETSKVKIESCLYSNTRYDSHHPSSSDEDLNGESVYYAQNKSFNNQSTYKKPKINPTDRWGHVRVCTFCRCLYHWLVDCPYAPPTDKNNLKGRDKPYKTYKPL